MTKNTGSSILVNNTLIDVSELNFHHVLNGIENMYWFFLLSIRTLSDTYLQNILKIKNVTQEGFLPFNHMLDKFNKHTNLLVEKSGDVATSKLNVREQTVFMSKAIAILTFDSLTLSKYNALINKDSEFQFLRHIRNGAAHNNKFNLRDEKGDWKIGENEIIKWGRMEICRKLHGSAVFNDFIALSSVFFTG